MIVLTGMPGCGKTTTGRYLGRLTGLPVFDVDRILLGRYGDLLGATPTERDWESFRKRERETIIELTEQHCFGIVALDGGAWMDRLVRDKVRRNHSSVYLNCSIDVLVERNECGRRVMFQAGSVRTDLQNMLRKRASRYEAADLVLAVDGYSAEQIAIYVSRFFSYRGIIPGT